MKTKIALVLLIAASCSEKSPQVENICIQNDRTYYKSYITNKNTNNYYLDKLDNKGLQYYIAFDKFPKGKRIKCEEYDYQLFLYNEKTLL